jgi:hypothetical protein
MTHFAVLVLAPAGTTINDAEKAVEPLLAAYDENLAVPEHEEECWCVGSAAEAAGLSAAWSQERVAERERLRQAFAALGQRLRQVTHAEPLGSDFESAIATIEQEAIRAELTGQRRKLEEEWRALLEAGDAAAKKVTAAHELYRKPDAGCEQCGGTGRWRTTGNPQGFWDWWEIGGRWTGLLEPAYDPEADARNYSPCKYCDAETRKRYFRTEVHKSRPEGLVGLAATEKDGKWEVHVPTTSQDPLAEESDCNVCGGTGVERNFGSAPVSFDAKAMSEMPEDFPWAQRFGAFVTPDGRWHQEGRVGWFAAIHREMDAEAWAAHVAAEVARHPDCVAVVVDCHI